MLKLFVLSWLGVSMITGEYVAGAILLALVVAPVQVYRLANRRYYLPRHQAVRTSKAGCRVEELLPGYRVRSVELPPPE